MRGDVALALGGTVPINDILAGEWLVGNGQYFNTCDVGLGIAVGAAGRVGGLSGERAEK